MKVKHSIAIAVAAAMLVGGAYVVLPDLAARVSYAAESGKAEAAHENLKTANNLSLAFQEAAKAVRPSVVSIQSEQKVTRRVMGRFNGQPMPDFPWQEFFGRRFQMPQPQEQPDNGDDNVQGTVPMGSGTGVILSADGYILTNNHVVQNADKVTVGLSNDKTYTAKVIGTDKRSDLAVVKIEATDLTPAKLGDSDALEVGEWVLAVGNPFGLRYSVTAGIVSAKGRSNVGITDYEDFLQTDAAINPGNSGGPLVNLKGEVVGINTAIASRSGGYMGIGFAIPIELAKTVKDSLIASGKVERGWLGVVIQNLDEDMAASFGYKGTDGVLVGDVTKGGPAEAAGFKQGDIIVTYDGKPMKNMNVLRMAVAATAPNRKAAVEIFRDGAMKALTVTVGELENGLAEAKTGSAGGEVSEELGMKVAPLSEADARQLGLPADSGGVRVTSVTPGGLAAHAGIAENDVVLSVNGKDIMNPQIFANEAGKADLAKGLRLRVFSGGNARFVFLKKAD
ncbi:MAG: DegQ family serine endoprotease [Planctomycetes bacterium]|nr:DegQ family serine endoprotease [Planctomycetota bacterium]